MDETPTLEQLRNEGLFPHQAHFIKQFLAPASMPKQVLVAPPGSGKRFMVRAIIGNLLNRNQQSRVLIITLPEFIPAWQWLLSKTVALQFVDMQIFRELVDAAPADSDPWQMTHGAKLLTCDLASHSDVRRTLGNRAWDLVVLEDAEDYGVAAGALIQDVLGFSSQVILISNNGAIRVPGIGELPRTTWTLDERDWHGRPLFTPMPATQLAAREFRRSDPEVRFAQELDNFIREHADHGKRGRLAEGLAAAASSSPAAGQQRLLEEREKVLADLTGKPKSISPIAGTHGPPTVPHSSTWQQDHMVASGLDRLIQILDELEVDRKLEVLLQLVKDFYARTPQPTRIVVFSEFQSTVDYLSEALSSGGYPALAIYHFMPIEMREATEESSRTSSNILLLSDPTIGDLNLSGAGVVVNYDLPRRGESMDRRWRAISGPSGSAHPSVVALRDLSGAFRLEATLLRRYGFL